MTDYTFYKPDGQITETLSCSPEELQMNLRPGEDYIEGWYSFHEYTIENGQAVRRTTPYVMPRSTLTTEQKLELLGLTVDELKAALA